MGFHCSLHYPGEEILNLLPNREEFFFFFFLKPDPNYDQPQISMFDTANVLIKYKSRAAEKQKPTG